MLKAFTKGTVLIDMSLDETTDWVYLNEYKPIINESTVHYNITGGTGTFDGTVAFQQLYGTDENVDFDTVETLNITSGTMKNVVNTAKDCIAIRFVYTKNNITAGTLKINYILA